MTIGIIGLGLIGGSFAKAVKEKTTDTVLAWDISSAVLQQAAQDKTIDGVLEPPDFSSCDLLLLSLYPQDTIGFLASYQHDFSNDLLIIDLCGVKKEVCDFAKEIFCETDSPIFIGGHPMAGREVSGYANASADLFCGSSMILTPDHATPQKYIAKAEKFFISLGFGRVTYTTPEEHDRIIAYTSQLAHIVSNAYMQSPTANSYMGFSAGSFADLTRVAYLNEVMWTELFFANRDPLLDEINILLDNLTEMRDMLEHNLPLRLQDKLRVGKEKKKRLQQLPLNPKER